MSNFRRMILAIPLIMLIGFLATYPDEGAAQTPTTQGNTPGGQMNNTPMQQGQQSATQTQAAQSPGPIVAGPGSTVVAPSPNNGNSGLIVAAPGSTVVVQQQAQTGNQAAKAATTSTHSFTKADLATINKLGEFSKNNKNFLRQAGAIDALGILGTGADEVTANAIVNHLTNVLETIDLFNGDGKEQEKKNPEAQISNRQKDEFICLHIVQALGSIGWGARSSLPHLQLIRGSNPILDSAIDRAVSAMQTSPAPQNTNNPNTTGTPGSTTPYTPQQGQ